MIKVSVVILNWNGKDLLRKLLGNVVKHSASDKCKIYLADNGSTDGSCEYVRENHPEVRILEMKDNYGFARGYNEALKKIQSEYFVLLNSDVEVSPGWLDPLTGYMDKHPEAAACQPKILSYHDRNKFEYAGAAGGYIDKYGYPFCRGRIMNITEEDKGQYDDTRRIFWASGACMLVRSSDWKESGGFDPDFFAHMEEIDLCWRLNNKGRHIVFIPGSKVYHIGGGTLPYNAPGKVYFNFRNNLYMLYKNLNERKRGKTLFIRMVLDGVATARFALTLNFKASMSVIRAHIHYYRHKKNLRQRREISKDKRFDIPSELILNKSLVFNFFIVRKRTFSELINN